MDQKIEKILNDLYALDPSLRERDGEIRGLVVSLIEAKPISPIDDAFIDNLRRKILSLPAPARSLEIHGFSWWAVRLAPLGAIAILILVFLPELTKPTPFAPVPAPEAVPSDEVAATGLSIPEEDGVTLKPPAQPPRYEEKLLTAMKISANIINVSSQKPGSLATVDLVELTSPGFVVIRSGSQSGEIIGSSKIIPSGVSGGISVDLSRSMREGETLYATLHTDDGDGSFDSSRDAPVSDAVTGEPMYVVFSVSASAPESAPGL